MLVCVGALNWLCLGDLFCVFGCGQQGERDEAGAGEDFRESQFIAVSVDFALYFEGGEMIALEFGEIVEGFVGAAFLKGTEFEEAFHLGEAPGGIGFVYPTVLGAIDLEGGKDVTAEGFFFEGAFGEAFFAQFLDVLSEVVLRFCVRSEEGVGADAWAMTH